MQSHTQDRWHIALADHSGYAGIDKRWHRRGDDGEHRTDTIHPVAPTKPQQDRLQYGQRNQGKKRYVRRRIVVAPHDGDQQNNKQGGNDER